MIRSTATPEIVRTNLFDGGEQIDCPAGHRRAFSEYAVGGDGERLCLGRSNMIRERDGSRKLERGRETPVLIRRKAPRYS